MLGVATAARLLPANWKESICSSIEGSEGFVELKCLQKPVNSTTGKKRDGPNLFER